MAEATRKLAAILSADVAGYSRLMEDDEEATVAALNKCREVFREGIKEHRGRVVDTAGDSVLAEFASVVEAVRAAVGIQETLDQHNDSVPDHRHMRFRIGVNLGDVIEQDDGTIYGDGVNVAARLESVAQPGGVMLSESAHMHVVGKIDQSFVNAGAHKVKNIARPIKTFAWSRYGGATTLPADTGTDDRKPTVAIGTFEGVGQSEEVTVLAESVRDSVAATLTNQTGMIMLDDLSEADYTITARIQVLGKRYRATTRVFDRRADEHFASDRFEGEISDLFESQDQLAYRIYMSMRFAVYGRESQKVDQRPIAEQGTQALLSRAGYFMFSSDTAKWAQAREIIKTVLEREPDDFMALAMTASSYLIEVICGYKEVAPEDREAAYDRLRQAMRINEQNEFAHFILSSFRLYCDRDHDAAESQVRRALEINPYYSLAMSQLGEVLIYRGQGEDGIELCLEAIDAHPRAPINHRFMWIIATGYFVLEQYDAAMEWARRSDQQESDVTPNLLVWTAAAAHASNSDEASNVAQRLRANHPGFDLSELRRWPFRDEATWNRFTDGLRQAGLGDKER